MGAPSFKNFCNEWVNYCITLNDKGVSESEKSELKCKKFEEMFYNFLNLFLPSGCKLVYQKYIRGIDYNFDFLFVKMHTNDFDEVDPLDVKAAFEVKSHGFFSYEDIAKIKMVLEKVNDLNPNIKLFYITFRETNTYNNKVHEIFSTFSKNYYRLSDSGDGVQLPPKKYFPEEWNKLISDLIKIRQ